MIFVFCTQKQLFYERKIIYIHNTLHEKMPPLAGNGRFLSSYPTCLFSIEQIIFGIIKSIKKNFFKGLKVIHVSLKFETIFLKAFQFSKSLLNIFQFQRDCLGRNNTRVVFQAIKPFHLFYSLYFSLPCFCYFLKISIEKRGNQQVLAL